MSHILVDNFEVVHVVGNGLPRLMGPGRPTF